jgi:hypothetical protein
VRGHIAHWLAPFFGDRALDAIRAEDVADLVTLMRAGNRPGGLRRTKPLSPKSDAQRDRHAQRDVRLRRSAGAGRPTNPCEGVELPPVDP